MPPKAKAIADLGGVVPLGSFGSRLQSCPPKPKPLQTLTLLGPMAMVGGLK